MTKLTTCMSIMLIAGFAIWKLIDIQVSAHSHWPGVVEHDRKVQEQIVNYHAFKHSFESALAALQKGEISLAEGVDRVVSSARRFNADYFAHLADSEVGASEAERVARNLIAHVICLDAHDPPLQSYVPRLKVELADLVKSSAHVQ